MKSIFWSFSEILFISGGFKTSRIYEMEENFMEERFEATQHRTAADGWVETGPVYKRSDGSTFTVPPKVCKDIFGGTYTTYGAYTQAELKKFSDADRKAHSNNW